MSDANDVGSIAIAEAGLMLLLCDLASSMTWGWRLAYLG